MLNFPPHPPQGGEWGGQPRLDPPSGVRGKAGPPPPSRGGRGLAAPPAQTVYLPCLHPRRVGMARESEPLGYYRAD